MLDSFFFQFLQKFLLLSAEFLWYVNLKFIQQVSPSQSLEMRNALALYLHDFSRFCAGQNL